MRKREGLLALIAIAVTGLAISFYVVCVVVGIADVQAAKRGCVFRGIIREVASVVTKLSPMGIGELILVNDASDHVCPFAERVREIISVFGCDGQGLPRENYLPPMLLRDIFERRNLLGWLQADKGKNEVATRLNFFIQAGRRIYGDNDWRCHNFQGWPIAKVSNYQFDGGIELPILQRLDGNMWHTAGPYPSSLGGLHCALRSVSAAYRSLNGIFIGAPNLYSKYGIDDQDSETDHPQSKGGLIYQIPLCLASYIAAAWGWCRVMLCRRERDLWLGFSGLILGFTFSVWFGLLVVNSIF